jgi:hypothetical protein
VTLQVDQPFGLQLFLAVCVRAGIAERTRIAPHVMHAQFGLHLRSVALVCGTADGDEVLIPFVAAAFGGTAP